MSDALPATAKVCPLFEDGTTQRKILYSCIAPVIILHEYELIQLIYWMQQVESADDVSKNSCSPPVSLTTYPG